VATAATHERGGRAADGGGRLIEAGGGVGDGAGDGAEDVAGRRYSRCVRAPAPLMPLGTN